MKRAVSTNPNQGLLFAPEPQKKEPVYFDTTDLPKEELKAAVFRAGSQNDMIMEYMKKHPKKRFTPMQVWLQLLKKKKRLLLQSVRRSLTTLTAMNLLVMHKEKKVKEAFGHVNCTWEYDPDYKPSIITGGHGEEEGNDNN